MNPFLGKLRSALNRSLQGRYGVDHFSQFLTRAAMVCLVLSWIDALSFLWTWAVILTVYGLFRIFSRNFPKRRAENSAYLQLTYKFRIKLNEWKNRWKERKNYKYFRCKGCKKLLRVPRGRGKLNVTCPQCSQRMSLHS